MFFYLRLSESDVLFRHPFAITIIVSGNHSTEKNFQTILFPQHLKLDANKTNETKHTRVEKYWEIRVKNSMKRIECSKFSAQNFYLIQPKCVKFFHNRRGIRIISNEPIIFTSVIVNFLQVA